MPDAKLPPQDTGYLEDLRRYARFDDGGLLEPVEPFSWETLARVAIDLAHARLTATPAQPVMPEPVAHLHSDGDVCVERMPTSTSEWPVPLYTAEASAALAEARCARMREALEGLRNVVIARNRDGAEWGEQFGALMAALALADAALAADKGDSKG